MKKKWICLLTALTLLIGVCAAAPLTSGAVVLDLGKKCSIKIYPESSAKPEKDIYWGDMKKADIVVDVYKVASATRQSGYDMYSYTFEGNYSDLTIPAKWDDITASYWEELAQKAGKYALEKDTPLKVKKDVKGYAVLTEEEKKENVESVPIKVESSGGNNGVEISNLDPGLYLIVPRSSTMKEVEDYKITMKSPDAANPVNGNIATIANSDIYTYIFSPEIISVPMRGMNAPLTVSSNDPLGEDGPQGNQYSSDDQGNWVYDLNVYLKPVRIRRYGALKIVKNLINYESEDAVQNKTDNDAGQDEKTTFVFKAEWTWTDPMDPDKGPKTETRVDSITFDGSSKSSQEVTIDRIPISKDSVTTVKVSEIYKGASYKLSDDVVNPQTIELKAKQIKNGVAILNENGAVEAIISDVVANDDGVQTITFKNEYSRLQRKGYGIKNEFKYDGKDGWEWYQDDDLKGTIKYDGTFIKKEDTPEGTE